MPLFDSTSLSLRLSSVLPSSHDRTIRLGEELFLRPHLWTSHTLGSFPSSLWLRGRVWHLSLGSQCSQQRVTPPSTHCHHLLSFFPPIFCLYCSTLHPACPCGLVHSISLLRHLYLRPTFLALCPTSLGEGLCFHKASFINKSCIRIVSQLEPLGECSA